MKQKSQFYFTSVSNIVIAEQEKKTFRNDQKNRYNERCS